jgi:ATP-dependent DNA ligase
MRYIYPPRPKSKITPFQLSQYEKAKKFDRCQRKFNGDRCEIHITADRKVLFYNRHKEPFSRFNASQDIIRQVLSLDLPEGEVWLDGELLKNRTTSIEYKDNGKTIPRIVLYDVLVYGGKYLLNVTWDDRQELLKRICRFPTVLEKVNEIALVVSESLWLAETWDKDFPLHYKEKVQLPEIEGLVLKKGKAALDNLGMVEYNVGWQIRCRKPSNMYSH